MNGTTILRQPKWPSIVRDTARRWVWMASLFVAGVGTPCSPAFAQGGNAAPVARNDSYTVVQGGTLAVAAPGVLANDTDANGDAITARLRSRPAVGSLSFSANGGFTYRPPSGYSGSVSFTYRAVDIASALSGVATVTITVTAAATNQPPQVTSTPVTTGTTGVAYSYDVNASDPNGDVLTYSLTQAPAGMTINAASGLIAWTPTASQAGSQAVTVRVADPGGLAATQSFSISVAGVNGPPQITSTPLTSATVGLAYAYRVVGTDPNGDALTYSLTQAPAGMAINATTGQITWTPTAAQAGSQAVTARVADPGGLAATQAFTISVAAGNAAPQITSAPVTSATVGIAYRYAVGATDPNGDLLTFSLSQAPSGMSINGATGVVTWTPSATQTGGQTVSVRVADPGGLSATQSFTVTVAAGSPVPTVTRVDAATPTTYAAAAGSMAAVTLNWYRLRMAANYMQFLHLVNATGQTWSIDDHWTTSATWAAGPFSETRTITVPAGLAAGSYDIRVGLSGGNPWVDLTLATGTGVTDPGSDHRYKVGTLTVGGTSGNQPPQIVTSPVTAGAAGAAYAYDVDATDPNGDVLTYSLTQAPSGMTIDASNGLIGWTPSSAQVGSQGVTVRVVDPGGLAATQSFTIVVAASGNGAPLITTQPTTAAQVGIAYSYDVDASDPNGDVLTYTLTQGPSGMTINTVSGLIAWTPTAAQVGNQAVTVRVADPGGLAVTQSFSVSVAAAPPPPAGPMTMSCADGAGWQCSGETLLRTDNGVSLTRSGVQAYGRSTSDMGPSNPNLSTATGLALASGGTAEIRVRKDANAAPNAVAVLLSGLSIYWSGTLDRPQIIETFNPTAGRVWLSGGVLTFGSLPPSSDLSYYDVATLGVAGTRTNYANNRYFPRTAPPRCDPGGWCATLETVGPQYGTGAWRSGGSDADALHATRNHEDGDVHAGNGLPDANGNPTWLPGGNGIGVPVPGSKGYRTLDLWNYRYASVASWFTEDTVNIVEWGGTNEHNKNRRGVVTFGDTTDPATVPASGSATYVGIVKGIYTSNGSNDPVPFTGAAAVTVNFASRAVTVTLQNTVREDTGAAVPLALTATTALGTGANANYATGTASNATLAGGLGLRVFGPVVAGGSGSGPAEIGGTFSISNSGSNALAIGGFIARKQ